MAGARDREVPWCVHYDGSQVQRSRATLQLNNWPSKGHARCSLKKLVDDAQVAPLWPGRPGTVPVAECLPCEQTHLHPSSMDHPITVRSVVGPSPHRLRKEIFGAPATANPGPAPQGLVNSLSRQSRRILDVVLFSKPSNSLPCPSCRSLCRRHRRLITRSPDGGEHYRVVR